jgi:riboflavin biosynthesis pyrimidine reductase
MRLLHSDDDLGSWVRGHDGTVGPEALALAYSYPRLSGTQTWVRANMVSTLDGAATGDNERSGSINTGADRDIFAMLRALTDVILVGAGTARIEGYQRARIRAPWLDLRGGRAAHPTMAIVSRSGEVPTSVSQVREDSGDVLLVTCTRAGDQKIDLARELLGEDGVIVEGHDSVDLTAALDALALRGMRRILCEGGPHLVRDLIASGRLDELCLTLAPTLVGGDHPRITAGDPVAAHFVPRLLIEADGTLLGRWVRP